MSEEKVFYPNGKEACVGDIIWTDEGRHVRKVVKVIPKDQAKLFCIENEGGVLVSRHIGEFDVGGLFFISQEWFEHEWIYPVEEVDMNEIEKMYNLIGQKLHVKIWRNPDFAYYPILNIETRDGKDEEVWYLFFQPSKDVGQTLRTELCYIYNQNRIEEIPSADYDNIRGMIEVDGGGAI